VFSEVVEAFEALISIDGAPKPLKKKAPVSFETLINTNPVTQSHSSSLKPLKDEGIIFFRNVRKLTRRQSHSSNLKTLKDEGTTFF